MTVYPFFQQRSRPTVLLILQGVHHLSLYSSLFSHCPEFHWACVLPNPKEVPAELADRLHKLYGVQIFANEATVLMNYGGIDAVITTFAVPHAAHGKYLSYIALAYELGLPVFELQHGMYQIGITYSESSAFVGSGMPGALTSLNAPNIVEKKLLWGESRSENEVSIGYPPFVPKLFNNQEFERTSRTNVLIATNTHWNILSEAEASTIWRVLLYMVRQLPDIQFTLMPHPGEAKSASFARVVNNCKDSNLQNLTIRRPDSRAEFIEMLGETRLAVSMVSTVLLDFELYEIPVVIAPSETQRPLVNAFNSACAPSDAQGLVRSVNDAYYGMTYPYLRTGHLFPFNPDRLTTFIMKNICGRRLSQSLSVPVIAKYLRGVK